MGEYYEKIHLNQLKNNFTGDKRAQSATKHTQLKTILQQHSENRNYMEMVYYKR